MAIITLPSGARVDTSLVRSSAGDKSGTVKKDLRAKGGYTTTIIGGSSSSRSTKADAYRDTARQLETIDPQIALQYESAARQTEAAEEKARIAKKEAEKPIFSTADEARGYTPKDPRFMQVPGTKAVRVPQAQQTIGKESEQRYKAALARYDLEPRPTRTQQQPKRATGTITTRPERMAGYGGAMSRAIQWLETKATTAYQRQARSDTPIINPQTYEDAAAFLSGIRTKERVWTLTKKGVLGIGLGAIATLTGPIGITALTLGSGAYTATKIPEIQTRFHSMDSMAKKEAISVTVQDMAATIGGAYAGGRIVQAIPTVRHNIRMSGFQKRNTGEPWIKEQAGLPAGKGRQLQIQPKGMRVWEAPRETTPLKMQTATKGAGKTTLRGQGDPTGIPGKDGTIITTTPKAFYEAYTQQGINSYLGKYTAIPRIPKVPSAIKPDAIIQTTPQGTQAKLIKPSGYLNYGRYYGKPAGLITYKPEPWHTKAMDMVIGVIDKAPKLPGIHGKKGGFSLKSEWITKYYYGKWETQMTTGTPTPNTPTTTSPKYQEIGIPILIKIPTKEEPDIIGDVWRGTTQPPPTEPTTKIKAFQAPRNPQKQISTPIIVPIIGRMTWTQHAQKPKTQPIQIPVLEPERPRPIIITPRPPRITPTRPIEPPTEQPPGITDIPGIPKFTRQPQKYQPRPSQGYSVSIRRAGKNIMLPMAYTKAQAIAIGGSIVDKTPAATFTIKKTRRTPTHTRRVPAIKLSRYTTKKGAGEIIFTEKKRYRIDSYGEIRGISILGAAKTRKKKGVKWI